MDVKRISKKPKFSIKFYLCIEQLDAYPSFMKTSGLGLLLTFVGFLVCGSASSISGDKIPLYQNRKRVGLEYGQLRISG